jgi:DNA-binding response OmpR family regulator
VNVLVVDADVDARQQIAMALQAMGHQVVGCGSGAAALGEAFKAEFDLAICDIDMPDLPGPEVVRAIKTQAPGLVAWIVGGREPSTWAAAAAEAGASRCLPKPLHHQTLRAELDALQNGGASLDVVVASTDRHHARSVLEPFRRTRCVVTEANRIADLLARLGERGADVVIVDGDLPLAHVAVTACALRSIPCILLDDRADGDVARAGPTLVVRRHTPPDRLLAEAQQLVARR